MEVIVVYKDSWMGSSTHCTNMKTWGPIPSTQQRQSYVQKKLKRPTKLGSCQLD